MQMSPALADPLVELLEIPVGARSFRALAAGPETGRPVLLLHGFPQTATTWRAQLTALARAGYRAVAFDQRGYSPKARPDDESAYGRAELAGDVLAVADTLGARRFDLAGHDQGGAIAWEVADRFPERVRSLTVVSTPHPAALAAAVADGGTGQRDRSSYIRLFRTRGAAEERMLANDAAYLRAAFAGLPDEHVAHYLSVLREPGALTAALNWYRAAGRADPVPGPVPAPTLYVWSDRDPAFALAAARSTADHVTGPYRFEVLRGVDHWVPENAAGALAALMLGHLAAH